MKKEIKEPEMKAWDLISFQELFRVKGRRGIYTLRSQVNKSGMCGMLGFMDYENKITSHVDHLENLNSFRFIREPGKEPLTIKDVFNNISEHMVKNGIETPPVFGEIDLDILVPCYDNDEFKPYHAMKVLVWFGEMFNKLKEMEVENVAGDDTKKNS